MTRNQSDTYQRSNHVTPSTIPFRVLRSANRSAQPMPFFPDRSAPRQPAAPPAVAVVLSSNGNQPAHLLPVLAGLGVTTIDRCYDAQAVRIVAAIQPQLVVVVCDPTEAAGAAMVSAMSGQPIGRLLIVDVGHSVDGMVGALELGADAAVSIRDDASIVRATVSALLRRAGPPSSPLPPAAAPTLVTVAGLTVDRDTCEVRESGQLVPLTRTEFGIVAHLAAHAGKVRSPGQIMSALHDYAYTDGEAQQAVKVYIRRIRRKLDSCSARSVEVLNSRSFGYRLQPAVHGVGLVRAA